ncbi:MAG: hypothetical protein WC364_00925 [Eubacteriales bacterium]|jgi:hypothetical protein
MGAVIYLDKWKSKKVKPKIMAWFIGPNKLFKLYLAARRDFFKDTRDR